MIKMEPDRTPDSDRSDSEDSYSSSSGSEHSSGDENRTSSSVTSAISKRLTDNSNNKTPVPKPVAKNPGAAKPAPKQPAAKNPGAAKPAPNKYPAPVKTTTPTAKKAPTPKHGIAAGQQSPALFEKKGTPHASSQSPSPSPSPSSGKSEAVSSRQTSKLTTPGLRAANRSDECFNEILRQRTRKKDYDLLMGAELAMYLEKRIASLTEEGELKENMCDLASQLYDNQQLVLREIDTFRQQFEDKSTGENISTFCLDELFATWWQSAILLISNHNMEGIDGLIDLNVSRPSLSEYFVQLWKNVCSHFYDDMDSLVSRRFDTKHKVKKILREICVDTLQQVVNRNISMVLKSIHQARRSQPSTPQATPLRSETPATKISSNKVDRIIENKLLRSSKMLAQSGTPIYRELEAMNASPSVVEQLYNIRSEKVSRQDMSLFD